MKSSNFVDFSIRQNKTIERSLCFDGIKRVCDALGLSDLVYVGFGSVWFVDFDAAHRDLGVETMVSIEGDDVLCRRAEFNKPYRTVEVVEGMSFDVLPRLLARADLQNRPWILWLDYDEVLDEDKVRELVDVLKGLPARSMLLTTFNVTPHRYGQLSQRAEWMQTLLGDAFPADRFESNRAYKSEERLGAALTDAVLNMLQSAYLATGRSGRFVPMFSLRYQDGSSMATAGGILAEPAVVDEARGLVAAPDWPSMRATPIATPPLTQKEVSALRRLLPTASPPTRDDVISLGFDLLPEQLDAFAEYYLKYPSFVQTAR
jgi:hypothetical protein